MKKSGVPEVEWTGPDHDLTAKVDGYELRAGEAYDRYWWHCRYPKRRGFISSSMFMGRPEDIEGAKERAIEAMTDHKEGVRR